MYGCASVACRSGDERPASNEAIQVVDDAGREIALSAPARRVVSLLPSFTEVLFAIGAGDVVVGRTPWCDWPPAVRSLPIAGEGIPPNVEAVAALRPDLVVLYRAAANVAPAGQLEALGIRAVLFDLNLLEDLGPVARRLGVLTGHPDAGEALARETERLAGRAPPPARASVVFVVWDNPPIVIGAGSYLHRLAALAGARNVFGDIPTPSAQVAIETIAARDPDFVVVLSDTVVDRPTPPAFASRREWHAVRAVERGRFLHLNGSLFGRPSPRTDEAVAWFRERLEAAR
jgi:ABC-type Fe3+-hydroxamate transport system substrate-binding protein